MENKVMLMMAVVFNLSGHEIDWSVRETYGSIVHSFDIEEEEEKLQQIGQELAAAQENKLKRKRSEESDLSEEGQYEVTNVPTPLVRDEQGRLRCPAEGCTQTFKFQCRLDTHMRTHTGERPFVCKFDGCDKTFSQPGNLNSHMKRHNEQKDFLCQVIGCGKTCSTSDDLKKHMRTHTRERHFVCKVDGCNKNFIDSSGLSRHMKKMH